MRPSLPAASLTVAFALLGAAVAAQSLGTWSTATPLPTARSEVAVATLGTTIYVIGGYGRPASTRPRSMRAAASTSTSRWCRRSTRRRGRGRARAAPARAQSHRRRRLRRTSVRVRRLRAAEPRAVTDANVYDPASDRWSPLAPLPAPLGSISVAVLDGKSISSADATSTASRRISSSIPRPSAIPPRRRSRSAATTWGWWRSAASCTRSAGGSTTSTTIPRTSMSTIRRRIAGRAARRCPRSAAAWRSRSTTTGSWRSAASAAAGRSRTMRHTIRGRTRGPCSDRSRKAATAPAPPSSPSGSTCRRRPRQRRRTAVDDALRVRAALTRVAVTRAAIRVVIVVLLFFFYAALSHRVYRHTLPYRVIAGLRRRPGRLRGDRAAQVHSVSAFAVVGFVVDLALPRPRRRVLRAVLWIAAFSACIEFAQKLHRAREGSRRTSSTSAAARSAAGSARSSPASYDAAMQPHRRRVGTERQPQTLRATPATSRSFAHCSSSVSRLPSAIEANPHCGLSASRSSGTTFAASSRRRASASAVFERAALRADETQHDRLVRRDETQRRERAGALVVVLEQETVDLELAEQLLGDRVVAAARRTTGCGCCRGRDGSPASRPGARAARKHALSAAIASSRSRSGCRSRRARSRATSDRGSSCTAARRAGCRRRPRSPVRPSRRR